MEDLWKVIQKHGPKGDFNDFRNFPPEGFMGHWDDREYFSKHLAWAVPSKEAIQKIKEFVGGLRVLEIGAGLGLWAKLLQDEGVDIIATDSVAKRKQYFKVSTTFTEVHDLNNIQALKKFPDREVVMLCWPPYSDEMGYQTLRNFDGEKFVLIGEGPGGCCGDDQFWEFLNIKYQHIEDVEIPQWYGLHDRLCFYQIHECEKRNRKIEF